MGGKLTLPCGGYYHATKHAVEAASDALRFEVRPFGVEVIVIEPGLIRTAFGDTATQTFSGMASNASSPYVRLSTAIARGIEESYKGRMAALAGAPESVARTIERAIGARRPKTRYVVTAGARMLMGMKWLLPDRAFDTLLRLQLKGLGY
jgi:short-subunit dehydrogenase